LSQLNKKLTRDMATHWAQVSAIVIVVALGIVMFSGPLLAQRDLRDSINMVYRRTLYEDFAATVNSMPSSAISSVADLPNVKAAEGRLTRDLLATVKHHQLTVRVISVPATGRPSVNGLIVESGRYPPEGEGETAQAWCVTEHHLTSQFGLAPGDTISVQGASGMVSLKMSGSVVSPEYLRLVRNRSEYVSDPAQFGVVFVRYPVAEKLTGTPGTFNDVVARVSNRKLLKVTMERARKALAPYGVNSLTSGADEPSAVTLDLELNDVGKIALFFAVLLLAVASLALYITMTQIVFFQQREIGITRAVGYDKHAITTHYLGYGAVLGTVGGVIGIAVGYALSIFFIRVYADVYGLPFVHASIYALIVIVGLAVGILFSIAGALVPARHAVRMKPAEAMRTEAGLSLAHLPHTYRMGIAARLGFPAWLRVSVRNLSRNRRRTLLTCLGVIGTLCLLVTAAGGRDSLDHAVNKYLNGVLRWDVGAIWQAPVSADALEQIKSADGVARAEPLIEAPALVVFKNRTVDVQIQAYQAGTTLHGSYPVHGSQAIPGPGQVVLNRGITTRLPVKTGDTVNLSTTVGSLPFKVSGFVSEPLGGICYVNLEYIQRLVTLATGVKQPFNAVVVKVQPGHEEQVASFLRGLPGVFQVLTKSGIRDVFDELLGAIRTLFLIFYVMAFAMGFAILFSMTTVNLLERGREIGMIRTMGAGRWRIFSFVTVETVAVVLAALIPGFLLGRLLEWVVIEKLLSSDRLAPDAVISGITVLVVIAGALVVMVLSELPSIRKLWHMDLSRVTKERAD